MQAESQDGWNLLSEILHLLSGLPSMIRDSVESLFYKIFEVFSRGIVQSTSSVASSIFNINVRPLFTLTQGANSFLSELGFGIAQFSFFIAMGLYVLPINAIRDEWRAKGQNGMIDACVCIILISMTPAIHEFFMTFSDVLSKSIVQSIDPSNFANFLTYILWGLIFPGTFFLLLVDMIALLIAFALIAIAFIVQALAPTLFLIAIVVYSLPLQLAKNTANKLFVQSILLYFLAPIGWAILAVDYVLLSTIVNPITPLIVLIVDILILKIAWSVSKDLGASFPVLNFIRGAVTTAVYAGALYLSRGLVSSQPIKHKPR